MDEGQEEAVLGFDVEAGTGVGHFKAQELLVFGFADEAGVEYDFAAFGEFKGVAEEVDQDLA